MGSVFILSPRRSPAGPSTLSLSRAGVVALMGSLFSMPALSDTLRPFVGASINHDDNLLRLSDDQLRFGDNGSDTYRSVTGGLKMERPVGRQLFSGMAGFSSVKFDRHGQLDYTGKDLSGEWHWFLAKHFEGRISASYAQALAPFADFHTEQRNLRMTRKRYADGSWRFHPSWRWRTSYSKDQYAYDLQVQRANDRTDESLMTGVDYLAASGSTAGFQIRRLKGRYPYRQSLGAGFVDNGYVQDEAKINVLWLATGSTQFLFLGGWVQRRQNARDDRADSGTNVRLIVNWTPAQRLKLVGQAWREFSAIEGALVTSALTTGSSAVTTWDFSEKIQVVVNLKHETRKFTSTIGAIRVPSSANPSDSNNVSSVGLAYKPLRGLTLNVSGFRDRRVGSAVAGTNGYKARGASFNLVQQF